MNWKKQLALLVVAVVAGSGALVGAEAAQKAAKPKKVRVFFIEPKNGATVSSPVKMKFGSEGIEISRRHRP
jgi:hypothetical protein